MYYEAFRFGVYIVTKMDMSEKILMFVCHKNTVPHFPGF